MTNHSFFAIRSCANETNLGFIVIRTLERRDFGLEGLFHWENSRERVGRKEGFLEKIKFYEMRMRKQRVL